MVDTFPTAETARKISENRRSFASLVFKTERAIFEAAERGQTFVDIVYDDFTGVTSDYVKETFEHFVRRQGFTVEHITELDDDARNLCNISWG